MIRLAIWGCNPTRNDTSPLEIVLKLDKYDHKPLPTCKKDKMDILEYRVLPLTRARDYLKIITSFAKLVEPFSNPDYTLTRNSDNESENLNAERPKLGERALYITAFVEVEIDVVIDSKCDPVSEIATAWIRFKTSSVDFRIHPVST